MGALAVVDRMTWPLPRLGAPVRFFVRSAPARERADIQSRVKRRDSQYDRQASIALLSQREFFKTRHSWRSAVARRIPSTDGLR
jgi:hypothetical protein